MRCIYFVLGTCMGYSTNHHQKTIISRMWARYWHTVAKIMLNMQYPKAKLLPCGYKLYSQSYLSTSSASPGSSIHSKHTRSIQACTTSSLTHDFQQLSEEETCAILTVYNQMLPYTNGGNELLDHLLQNRADVIARLFSTAAEDYELRYDCV